MKIALFGQYYQNSTAEIVQKVVTFLESNAITIAFEASFLASLKEKNIILKEYETYSNYNNLDADFKALISIGGDGTILRAATYVRDLGIPILGVNAGRLGFLAKVQKENIASFLQIVIEKKYTISERTVLGLTTSPKNSAIDDFSFAMNEVTVNRKDTTSMITIETYLNGEYLNSYWADGLIISTPTGSTGYSLSCGGPVLTPDVKSLVITPIAPHNLNARPLVIPDDTEIELHVSGREENYLVSLDSRTASTSNKTILKIKKSPYSIKMVEIPNETFLKTLRNKLLWGQDKRN
jgi:NAD+ kinase